MSFLEVITSALPFPFPGGCWQSGKDTDDRLGSRSASKSSVLTLLLVLEGDVVSALCLKWSPADQDKRCTQHVGELRKKKPQTCLTTIELKPLGHS